MREFKGSRCELYVRTSPIFLTEARQLAEIKVQLKAKGCVAGAIRRLNDGQLIEGSSVQDILNEIVVQKPMAIICWRLDTFGRIFKSLDQLLEFLAHMDYHSIRFISVQDKLDTTENAGAFLSQALPAWIAYKKNLRREHARKSLLTAKLRGTPVGRPKIRNDEKIKTLRVAGLSIRAIANELGVSTTAVQRALKTSPKNKESENQSL